MNPIRKSVATVAAAGVLVGGGMVAPAYAQPQQDGLVNVVIDDSFNDVLDVTVEDVSIGVAAQIAANICGVKVGPVAVLGVAVDRSGGDRVVCQNDQGSVTLVQN